MARSLVLSLQKQSALAVLSRTGGRGIVVEAVVPIPLAEGDDVRSTGAKIAAALASFSAARASATIALPRADLQWANYELPPAPADELSQLVELQAQRDFVIADDGLGFDFLSLEGDEEHAHRVLGVGLPPAQLQRVRGIADAAGLKLTSIVPEPLGWVELGRRAADMRGATGDGAPLTAFAAIAGRQAAVWATWDERLRLVRTVYLPAEPSEEADIGALAGEVRRTLLALSQMAGAPSATLPCIYIGDAAARVAGELAALLSRPVRAASLEDLVEAPVADLAAVAPLAALAASDRAPLIDLLHPHRPPAPPSRRRTYILAGAAAACLAAAAGWAAWSRVATPLAAAAEADAKRAALAEVLKRSALEEEKAAAVDAWLAQSVNLLTELEYLAQQLRPKPLADEGFNSAEDLVITKLTLAGRQLTLDASARSTDAVQPIERRLRDGRYRVMRGVVETQAEGTPGYAARMSEVIERLPAEAAAAVMPAAAGPAAAGPAADGAAAVRAATEAAP